MNNFSENNYLHFTETDFINDPFFQDWIVHSTDEIDQFWKSFLKSYPEKTIAVENAKKFLQHVEFDEEILDDEYIHQRYLQHLKQVHQTRRTAKIFGLNIKVIRKMTSVAALVAAVILVASVIFVYNKNARAEKVVVATKFGEIKKVFLPDGSEIILNAHSNVSFAKDWQGEKPREIWLNGEAFINVQHVNNNDKNIKPSDKFLVHGEAFTIEVLGTSFDIRQRRGKTEVVLQTGKIKLALKDVKSSIIMMPGDFVSYNPGKNSVVKTKTVPQDYAGWKEKKLILNNPTLEEITKYLEDNFGKRIEIQDENLKRKKIEGTIPLDNLNDALFIISLVYKTDIETNSDRITIRSK